jgi:hypothetical protein
MRFLLLVLFVGIFVLPGERVEAATPTAKLLSVKKIWDQAPHNAFTDLIYWKDRFLCAFREGRAHVATDGKIRVLSSTDGEKWLSAAQLKLDGIDLRDACLSVMPDNRLMLCGGAAPRKTDKELSPTGTFVAYSKDGEHWTQPQIIIEPGRWMWRVVWHGGKAYGISYGSARPISNTVFTSLLVSEDARKFHELAPKLTDDGMPTEAALRFADDDTLYCLQRRDGKPLRKSALFGSSRPPYKEWEWTDLGIHVGGPNFIQLPSGRWVAAGRFFDGKAPKTKLAWLDVKKKTIEPILTLPSGGDTSYPGLVWHDNLLWMSYYSSHEGKTSIYLAKVKVD